MNRAIIAAIGILVVAAGVALTGAGPAEAGGGCHQTSRFDGAGVAVDLSGSCFEPTVIRVQPGDTITWTNRDPAYHTVTGVAQSWGTYDSLAQDAAVSYQFKDSGVYPYFCVIHPGMVGAVVVGDGTRAAAAIRDGGSNVVSVAAPGAGAASADAASTAEADGGGVSVLLAAGIAVAVGLVGTGAGVAVGRRRRTAT